MIVSPEAAHAAKSESSTLSANTQENLARGEHADNGSGTELLTFRA